MHELAVYKLGRQVSYMLRRTEGSLCLRYTALGLMVQSTSSCTRIVTVTFDSYSEIMSTSSKSSGPREISKHPAKSNYANILPNPGCICIVSTSRIKEVKTYENRIVCRLYQLYTGDDSLSSLLAISLHYLIEKA